MSLPPKCSMGQVITINNWWRLKKGGIILDWSNSDDWTLNKIFCPCFNWYQPNYDRNKIVKYIYLDYFINVLVVIYWSITLSYLAPHIPGGFHCTYWNPTPEFKVSSLKTLDLVVNQSLAINFTHASQSYIYIEKLGSNGRHILFPIMVKTALTFFEFSLLKDHFVPIKYENKLGCEQSHSRDFL